MKKIAVLSVLLIILTIPFISGQKDPVPKEGVVSFDLMEHVIVVKVKIDTCEREFNFIVDTGGMTFLDNDIANQLKLKRKGFMVKINTLTMGDFRVDKVFCFTTFDFKPFDRGLGFQLHGMIGSDLLERFKVTLDYKKNKMILSSNTGPLTKSGPGYLLKFKNHPVNNSPLIKIKLDGQWEVEAMIDTGQPFPVLLPLGFLDKPDVLSGKNRIKSKGVFFKWPMTTAEVNYLSRVRSLEIGGLKIRNALSFYAELPSLLSVPCLGQDLLNQFLITIDYPNDEILLVPYGDTLFKSNEYSIGLNAVRKRSGNGIEVGGVWTGSPADKAGIETADEIINVNGKAVTGDYLFQFRQLLLDDNVHDIAIVIKNVRGERTVKLKKKLLFSK